MSTLRLRSVTVTYGHGASTLRAAEDVDLEIPGGGILGLVGESGCGKSSLARAICGLAPVTSGSVLIDGEDISQRPHLQRRIQMVFQNPYASLNPRMTVGDALWEAVSLQRGRHPADRRTEVARLLELVALDQRHAGMLPRQLSGGQRQRVAIARALAVQPDLLIADEITSALDASVQSLVLNLLRDLRARLGISILFISHNLATVRYVSDRIAVMYLGRIVEEAPAQELVRSPRHPYTGVLLEAVPGLRVTPEDLVHAVEDDPPDPRRPPSGCRFHPRCPVGPRADPQRRVCIERDPQPGAAAREHRAACHFVAPASP